MNVDKVTEHMTPQGEGQNEPSRISFYIVLGSLTLSVLISILHQLNRFYKMKRWDEMESFDSKFRSEQHFEKWYMQEMLDKEEELRRKKAVETLQRRDKERIAELFSQHRRTDKKKEEEANK
ncbi:unnamed protein product [Caenorhabditis auriculariae]|uniref:Uncharacterized protein n=1 Tax=Caenorhabditis auriculariae TaxID=2777116 RepID=A0A8S1GXS6_9PELO|nr:unnamed protein product [Caenorhabditis auriculariae]